ncbi:MAG: alpha/beta hydrolase [Alphaproteobacteria bacterium]|nr:alpha/beta hydrolase [Alphaproteobacteria bacterium]
MGSRPGPLGALVLVWLTACGPVVEPGPAAWVTPSLGADVFIGPGGARPLRVWAAADPRAVMLALHGFNDYSNAFAAPAAWWAEQGITTYAYDQVGFGGAASAGRWHGTAALVADLCVAARLVQERHPATPLYLLGESMGGAVILVAAGGSVCPALRPAGIVLAAPAVWGRETMSPFYQAALWLGAHLAPGVRVTGRGLGITPSDNRAMLQALAADPLVIKETRVDAVHGIVDLMDEALARIPSVRLPSLVLYGAHDEIIPPAPTRVMLARWTGRPRFAYYRDGYHMLLRDLQAETVWRDIAAWLRDARAPLPSGADIGGVQAFTNGGPSKS